MLIYLLIIFSIYFGFVITCIIGWFKFSSSVRTDSEKIQEFVSVIIAIRNEEHVIIPLLNSLGAQDYLRNTFEIIFVDDHSTDHTLQYILGWKKDNPMLSCSIIPSDGHGKKWALSKGIQYAKGEVIITTDADCILPVDWISRMVYSFNPSTSMVIGLVKINPDQSMFATLQAMEFNSLMASSMALLAHGYPVMCNGASLAFRKSKFEAVGGYKGNIHIPSGDDEFLMRKLNHLFPGTIKSVPSPPMVVITQPQPDLKRFVHQRLRWAGKWKANDSIVAKGLAMFILVFQLTCILSLYLILTGDHVAIIGTLLSVKIILEAIYLTNVGRYVGHTFSIPAFIILQVVYPFYVVIIGVLSQLLDYEWKGRPGKASG